ncbi:MAG: DUF1854 domain-containing protein [Clostridia bacterium]|nr:DUF1854 domain-containing protein [Clostridia bacterium]
MKHSHTMDEEKTKEKKRTLAELSVTVWLTPENTSFFLKNGFLYIRYEEREERAFLCREFPFEMLWEFISVLDENQQEIGIVRRIDAFEGEMRELLVNELNRRYYSPVIEAILQVKERYGFSYWKVRTQEGTVSFTLHDTFRSIVRADGNRLILLDVDGNRFEIPNAEALDRKSYKKIELYL